jgi:hypothetical protein
MKALPPSSPQLQLVICRKTAMTVVDRDTRNEVVRTLAEILLIAADATAAAHVRAAIAEENHETT